ncbi:hypothetical protein ABIF50_002034 [Bradyrhizobium diazoefficiens]|jgi:hypothetical protein
MGAVSNMEGFSRSSDYLGNVKALIIPKIVRIFFEESLRLTVRDGRMTRSSREIFERCGRCEIKTGVLQLDEAVRVSPN